MKDVLSYETALALKEAGFTQPHPEPGQIWYDLKGKMFICTKVTPGWMAVIMPGDLDTVDRRIGELVFAPSVADLLRELTGLSLSFVMGVFFLYGDGVSSCRTNPAELLAAAWLERKAAEK